MKSLFTLALIIFIIIYFTEISNFVKGNAPQINQAITKWFTDHTPKK